MKKVYIIFCFFIITINSGCVFGKYKTEKIFADVAKIKLDLLAIQRKQYDEIVFFRNLNSELEKKIQNLKCVIESQNKKKISLPNEKKESTPHLGNIDLKKNKFNLSGEEGCLSLANGFFDKKMYEKAIIQLNSCGELGENFNSGDVYFLKGESYRFLGLEEKNIIDRNKLYKKSILSFQKLITDFPESEKYDLALFRIGELLEELNLKKDAIVFYRELIEKHEKSILLPEAKSRILKMRKNE